MFEDKRLPIIIFDMPVEIANAVLNGYFVMEREDESSQQVLAWNQGQLQIFTRQHHSKSWNKQTQDGDQSYSGWMITDLIQRSNEQVKNFMDHFTSKKSLEVIVPSCLGAEDKYLPIPNICRGLKRRIRRVRIDKLKPTRAHGYIDWVKIR
ncbi:BgTH12-05247 [Blumeria graminis f. sp. triticale]|uniref:BgTH12-05247 n=2 Tax=Blumeria graminis TaxID=34373 RepID=A0A9W4GEK7_BLUGR|nr:BgTH12-05247 [Blumeria graminis f. sp. triticale]